MMRDEKTASDDVAEAGRAFRESLDKLARRMGESTIYFVPQIPALNKEGSAKGISRAAYQQQMARVNQELAALTVKNLVVVPPLEKWFEGDLSRVGDASGLFYYDDNHLNNHGSAIMMRPVMDPLFETIAKAQ